MKIHLIWAQDNNGGIGQANQLPWKVSEDLKHFKKLTLNSTIIMGRKTWDSLPVKPLPNRRNIILSRNTISNIETYRDYKICINSLLQENLDKIFIIGGASIYKLFFQYADYLHITFVDLINKEIDTFYPFSMDEIKGQFIKVSKKKLNDVATYTAWSKK